MPPFSLLPPFDRARFLGIRQTVFGSKDGRLRIRESFLESSDANDFDDASAARFPDIAEICDGIDNDCDGFIDEGLDCFSSSGVGGGGCFLQAMEKP